MNSSFNPGMPKGPSYSVPTRAVQCSFWRRARRPGCRRLGRRPWSRPRSTGVHSASLHPYSVCPSWFDKIIHVGRLTICRKRALEESFFIRFGVIKSTSYSMEFVTVARTFSMLYFTPMRLSIRKGKLREKNLTQNKCCFFVLI